LHGSPILIVPGQVTEVPKVTSKSLATAPMSPPLCGLHQAEGDDAKPEVDQKSHIYLEELMPCYWRKGRHYQKVHPIAQQNCEQGLHEVDPHRQLCRWTHAMASLHSDHSQLMRESAFASFDTKGW